MSHSDRDGESFHQLVLSFGRERARDMVEPRHRLLIDIAAEVLADEQQQIGISYTGFCLTSLPHKKLPDDQSWERHGHKVTLLIEPGTMRRNGQVVKYGVPYGSRARMILLYLQTQAVRTGSREIELGRSMRAWMERMDVAVGGETLKSLKEQAARISACSLKFYWEGEEAESWARGGIVSAGLRFKGSDADADRWDDRVVLDEVFWKALKDHPVPLQEAALRQLAHRSLAMDVYVWLAWRCHQLRDPIFISWPALSSQFNTSNKELKRFKPLFWEALRAATAAYPGSRVEVSDERDDRQGIIVHPAKPPVLKLVK